MHLAYLHEWKGFYARQDTQCINRIYQHGVPYYRIAKEGFSFRGTHLRVRCSFYQGGLEADFQDIPAGEGLLLFLHSLECLYFRSTCMQTCIIDQQCAHSRRVLDHHRQPMECKFKELFSIRI